MPSRRQYSQNWQELGRNYPLPVFHRDLVAESLPLPLDEFLGHSIQKRLPGEIVMLQPARSAQRAEDMRMIHLLLERQLVILLAGSPQQRGADRATLRKAKGIVQLSWIDPSVSAVRQPFRDRCGFF